jgi:hypothetical protein
MRKLLVIAATSFAIAAAPTIASAQQAAARSPALAAEVQPASEEVEGSELNLRTGFILPLLVVAGIILALLLLIDENKEDFPVSP